MRITTEDLDWFTDWEPQQKWQFAKSMPDSPHSYVVRGKTVTDEEFQRAVRVIRTFGEPAKFWSRTHIYLTVGTKRFWTMGDPMATTTIINVADDGKEYGVQDAPKTYTGVFTSWNEIATTYDETFPWIEEEKAARSVIIEAFGAFAPKTLDVGCGTGRVLDMGLVPHSMYTGVDSSQAMLNEFVRKTNKTRKKMPHLLAGRAEDVEFGPAYDLGLALMGVASEVEPEVIDQMAACCSYLVLMPHTDGPNAEMCRTLDGAVVRRVGEFDLITVRG